MEQKEIELIRFKQNCRTIAFDKAHAEKQNVVAATAGAKGADVDILDLADKYYKWLVKQ